MTQANAINAGSTGFQSFNGTGTFAGRTLQGGTGISITNGNGVSGDPTISASGAAPNANVMISDDFFGANASSSFLISQLAWEQGIVNWQALQTTESNRPGLITNQNFGTSTFLFLRDATLTTQNNIVLGGGVLVVDWVFKIGSLSVANPRYTLQLGLGDTDTADQANGCYFEYSDNINSGNWNIKTAAASSRTTTTTATTVTTGWHHATITVNAAASSVNFVMDGVSLGSITTNIPTLAVTPFYFALRNVGTVLANSLIVDLFYLNQTLTTPR